MMMMSMRQSALHVRKDFGQTDSWINMHFAHRISYDVFAFHLATASAPEFLPASISQGDVGVDECVVNVVWSEPFISCTGSVSQYVLSVTPPTSDCGSGSEDCVLVTDQTHYDLTLTVDQTYNLTVRADTCTNTLTGEYSDPLSINTG